MTCRKFFCTVMIMFLLFSVSGCGGGSSNPNFAPNIPTSPDNTVPVPVPDSNDTPAPIPEPSPQSQDTPAPIPEPTPQSQDNPAPIPEPTPESEDNPAPTPEITPVFTVTFDSNGGSYIETQEVEEEERAVQPDDPELEGHVFVRWLDENDDNFNFDSPVYDDLVLTAEWEELEEVTEEETTALQEAVFGGQVSVSFDSSPLCSVDVTYDFADSAGFVEVSEVTDGPILNTAGLIGSPVNIKSDLSELKETAITFHYDPALLTVSPNDLGIVWYDESNDRMILLSKDVTIDTYANTIKLSSDHFSIYGLVSVSQWEAVWSKRLPTIRSGDIKYNVVIIIDCSGSMSNSDVQAAVSSSQNLIDSLSDEDYAAVLAFGWNSYESVIELIGTTKIGDNRQAIKDSMSSLYSYGGTYIAAALTKSLQYKMSDTSYKNLVVLLSDGQDYVNDAILQELKDNSMKVITVGLGYVDKSLMERIANTTEGSYLYASSSEQLEDKFKEVANTDFGLDSADNDNDGLPDAFEEAGMRDLFGREWITDSKDEDSDDDGLKDGEEILFDAFGYAKMGYAPSELVLYRSNPNLYTEKANDTLISIPNRVYCETDDISTRTLSLRFRITNYLYKETHDKEIFYAQAKDEELKYEVVDLPEGFTSSGLYTRKLTTRLTEDKTHDAEVDYYVEFTVHYPKNQSRTLKTVNIRHVNNTPGEMELTYLYIPVEYANTQVRSYVVDSAKAATERLENQYIRALMKEIKEVQQDDTAMKDSSEPLKVLAKEITARPLTFGNTAKVPNQVFQAFAESIKKAVEESIVKGYDINIDDMNNKPMKFITTFMKDWASSMENIFASKTQTVNVGSTSYKVEMNIMSYAGIGVAEAYVSTAGQRWHLTWASGNKEINKALGNYCVILSQLAESVIEQFWTICINDFFKEIGSSKQVSQTMIHNAELVIKILGGSGKESEQAAKELAQAALKYVNSKTQAVLKNKLQKITGKDFELEIENFVKNLPDGKGKKFMENAQKLKKISEKYDDLKEAIGAFASFSHGSGGSTSQAITDMEKAYSGFKSVYDKLNDDDLFSDKVPLIDFIIK